MLSVVVLADGTVGDVKVESSTNAEFNNPAIEAARITRYEPAMRGGAPVACRVPITSEFNRPKRQ
jgi:TonB family protein